MSLARYFVFKNVDGWMVTLDGAPIGRHRSRPDALGSAIVMADLMGTMHHEADVMVEDDGALAVVWTFGVDLVPEFEGAVR